MPNIHFQILQTDDKDTIRLIAEWYLTEWKIPIDTTIQRLESVTTDNSQFQVVMTIDNIPIATGGLFNHVGLLDKEPRFKMYKKWLALVYTIPNERNKGFGSLICKHIQDHSKNIGIDTMYLFTDTAVQLYKRLGWIEMEKLTMAERDIVVMEKTL